jgi:hypothetical protein
LHRNGQKEFLFLRSKKKEATKDILLALSHQLLERDQKKQWHNIAIIPPAVDRNSNIFFLPFADLFIYFSFAKLIFPSIFFIFKIFRSLDGLPTTIDGGYLISTTPKECQYRFSMAHSERMAFTLPFYLPWSPFKRMREDRNGFIAVFALFICLGRVCGFKKGI